MASQNCWSSVDDRSKAAQAVADAIVSKTGNPDSVRMANVLEDAYKPLEAFARSGGTEPGERLAGEAGYYSLFKLRDKSGTFSIIDETPDEDRGYRLHRYAQGKFSTFERNRKLRRLAPGARSKVQDWCGQMDLCAGRIEFSRPLDEVRWYISAAYFCGRHKLCGVCAQRRTGRLLNRYVPRIIREVQANPKAQILLPIFSGPHSEDLRRCGKRLCDAYSSLLREWRDSLKSYKRNRSPLTGLVGSCANLEIKRGKGTGLWHPHLHAVWVTDRDLHWRDCQERYAHHYGEQAIVTFKTLRCNYQFRKGLISLEEYLTELPKQLLECFKYFNKFEGEGELAAGDLLKIVDVTQKWRGLRVHGALYNAGEAEPDLTLPEEGPLPDFDAVECEKETYRFYDNGKYGFYVKEL